ncbi:Putative peptidase C14, caspase domain, Zinc finger C2H2-type, transcription factor Grauzone [Colletotrichum destructivum]|uniref:Peptidase C14, caspase domain, Zinc finger C2H2-type, transcription factor Grauzone n=1 Tax=Colletotrichum destructivum TaxID=34406 RepID=A0AAX4J0T5_9PEZI|nr:Putative peptidase C14, caspase domain, Zinc finger C2H2-type, transcription factor Grauzone [Colletotrichum destructivum]
MEESQPAKRRKLLPRQPSTSTTQAAPFTHELPQQHPVQEAPPAERHDFESFARHLQDAAMLIQRQTERSPYDNVSVLLLRWEEDTSVEADLTAMENILRSVYNFRTDRWAIPTVPNPSIKLGVQMASFLDQAKANHLLIIYYAGHGYVGSDNQLYWACNTREDAAKLKWDGVRCLFEDAQSDILLLLDTCSVRDVPVSGSHGTKQAIAACGPEQTPRETAGKSFTYHLIEALHKLSTAGRPFSVPRLHEEVVQLRQLESGQATKLMNGSSKTPPPPPQIPICFTLTPGKGQSLNLAPLPARSLQQQSPRNGASDADGQTRTTREDQLIDPESVTDLRFDEARVLVCTTFVGDASPDMSFFNSWLHNTPPLADKIEVEGMFLGPPTMLLISMPHSIWNVVQHDKVCCFLGYITSHNMIQLYQKLKGSSGIPKATAKEVEDGRILLEARELAASTPVLHRRSLDSKDASYPEAASRVDTTPSGVSFAAAAVAATAVDGKDDVEDSAEMQEAAEQLKALSHVRHLSDEAAPTVERQRTTLPDGAMPTNHEDTGSSHDANESGADDTMHSIDMSTPNARSKQRRSLQKATPKQETRCTLCSHAPFKDSSSLRKHIAAAHTRPFPCAFSFAGCTSTFGSKNEWKRHIASQHLCLQYYRCSSCPQSTVEGKGNEFNRKDLFTQHLRRMHAPFAIKKAIAKGDSKLQVEWEGHVKEMQTTCLVTRRSPPQKSACPKLDCQSVFEGPGSWDEWTEHVGRHMEKGEGQRLGVDRLLAKWALDEGIIERKGDGEYRLCAGNGPGPVSGSVGGGGIAVSGEGRDSISVLYPEPKQEVEAGVEAEVEAEVEADTTEDKMEVDS